MMVGLLNRPEEISPDLGLGSIPITGPVFDEELLRWIAEAEYLGVSRETAILIATKRRALNLSKIGSNLVVDTQNKDVLLPIEKSPPSCSKEVSQTPENVIRVESDIYFKQDSGMASLPISEHEEPCSEGYVYEEDQLSLDLQLEEQRKPTNATLKNSSQTSSTQETITTKFDGLLDQVINSTIARINFDESKRKKKKNKRRKRFPPKNIFNTNYHNEIPLNSTSNQSINAQLLKTIVEKDSSSKVVLSDNNSSVDTTMGVVNSGTNQVDRLTAHCSGLDAVVAAHSNNPFNNNGRNYNFKVKRRKRYYQRNNSNASSSTNKHNHTQNTQLNSTIVSDFPEPSRMNLKHTKRNFNRNRKSLGLNPNSISEKVTENSNHAITISNSELRNSTQQYKSSGGNGRRMNNSERGRIRPKKSEAVEHVREQLRIAYRSRGVLEI